MGFKELREVDEDWLLLTGGLGKGRAPIVRFGDGGGMEDIKATKDEVDYNTTFSLCMITHLFPSEELAHAYCDCNPEGPVKLQRRVHRCIVR